MVFYFVQRGETLYHIAKRYQTTVHAIVAANRLDDPNAICPGQALIIPKPGEVPSPPPGGIVHLVRPGETIFHLSSRYGTSPREIMLANALAHPEFILPGQQLVLPEKAGVGDEWPMAGRTPSRTGSSPAILTGTPAPSWWQAPRHRQVMLPSAPVVRYDRVYVGLGDGTYYCIDRSSGRINWRLPVWPPIDELTPESTSVDASGEVSLAAPAVFDGLVYLGTPGGVVLAVDAYRGRLIWKVPVDGPIHAGLAIAGGLVYVATCRGEVLALEAKTGAVCWQCGLGQSLSIPCAIGDGLVYVVDSAGGVAALDAQTGAQRWRRQEHGAVGAPVFAEVVLVTGGQGLDPRTGDLLWTAPEPAPPVLHGDSLYFPGGAVDACSGEYRWRPTQVMGQDEGDQPAGGLVAAGEHLLAATMGGRLNAWRVQDGTPAWSVALGAPAAHPPTVVPGLVVVTLTDGSVRAVRVRPNRRERLGA